MSLSETRLGANATPLPAPAPLPPLSAALSRRAALFGAVTVAGVSAAACTPAKGHAATAPLTIIRPSPDAELILLAGRVEALAGWLERLFDRCSELEDRIFVEGRNWGQLSLPPEPPSGIIVEWRDTATERVGMIRQPFTVDPAREAWERARDDAKAAQESAAAALSERLGLPALERRRDRTHRRLHRWASQLAEMEAATAAGLSAKARAFLALGGGNRDGVEAAAQDYPDLALSILTAVSAGTWLSA